MKIDKSSPRGFLAAEVLALTYLLFTVLMLLFTYTSHPDGLSLLVAHFQVAAIICAVWWIHYMLPCRFLLYVRVLLLGALLSWFYADTYSLNQVLPNLDHLFASYEQELFGYQPSLELYKALPSWMSEPIYLGYWSLYPMVGLVFLYYLIYERERFFRASFVLLATFYGFYVIFDLIPVVGPTFYFEYVGLSGIREGIFPEAGTHFMTSQACLPSPGDSKGFFYGLVKAAQETGEFPTGAFPSSHVGCATVMMLLAFASKRKVIAICLIPLYILLCVATVYIQAHYAIDAIVGFFTGVSFYFIFDLLYKYGKLR